MADISLRDYLGKLDTLVNKNSPSEVVHHCRHILQYFPKNAETYRYLGRALVQSSSWEEAGEVFQRVLSVYPDDYTAHFGLSDVYLHLKRPDDAIWHMERAFEQNPNNQTVIEGLREMYRRFRRIEQNKIQLTAGAVARQYIRNGLYEQAIETLRQALERSPERADLRILLAQTYSEAGYRVEAAEVALEVLKTLPDCLEANRILTELWLAESRPSDAQRYLNRIQSVEPYLALELAQGQPPPDDAFRLEELDYRRAAEREILTSAPDWLRDVGSGDQSTNAPAASEDSAWLGSFAPTADTNEDDLPVFDDAFSTDLPDDWLTAAAPEEPTTDLPPIPRKKTGVTGLLNRIEGLEPTPEPEIEAEPDFESLFGGDTTADELFPADDIASPQADEPLPDLPDLFALTDEEPAAPAAPLRQTGALKETDPLAWLHESGIEIVDNPEVGSNDLFGADEDNLALQDVDAANPLAWLQGYGDDMINENAQPSAESLFPADEPDSNDEDNADPLAWLQDSGVEIVEETPAPLTPSTMQTEEADPLDWLADESMLDEALDLEALIDPGAAAPRAAQPVEEDDSGLDWLNSPDAQPEVSDMTGFDAPRMEESVQGEPLPDWFAEESPIDLAGTPDWFADVGAEETSPAAEASAEAPDWFTDMGAEEAAPTEEPIEPVGAGMLNWLSGDAPAAATSESLPEFEEDSDVPDWMSETSVVETEATLYASEPEGEVPDWLSQLPPSESESEFEPEAPAAVAADEDEFSWMTEARSEAEPETETVADIPSWMSEAPTTEGETVTEFSASDEDDYAPDESVIPHEIEGDELTLIEGIGPKIDAALRAAGITTFAQLASTSPEDLYPLVKDVPIVGDANTWPKQAQFLVDGDINGFYKYQEYLVGGREPVEAAPEPEATSEPAAEVDDGTPEWMSEMPNTDDSFTTPEPADDSGFEWMSEEPEAEPAADVPDWLSTMQPADEPQSEPEPATSSLGNSGFEWMSEVSADDAEAEPAADVPDWLSSMQPADEPQAEPAASSIGDSGFEWMSEVSADDAEAEPAADVPDWLSSMQPADEPTPEPATSSVGDAGFEWMSEVSADDAEAEPAADVPDWLSSMQPADEPQVEPEPAAATVGDAGFEWMSEVSADDAEAEPAADVPDWLSSMQPADEPQVEPEPATSSVGDSGFEWMSDLQSEDDEDSAIALPAADAPDWLSQIQPADEPEAEAASLIADDTPEWLSQMQAGDEAEDEVEPAAETPDWLSQAKPAVGQTVTLDEPAGGFPWEDSLDSDEPEEEAVSEDAPEWLSNIQSSQSSAEAEPAAEPIGGGFSWMNEIDTDEPAPASNGDLYAEEVAAPAPASNAPDWLNAMVPGLDVDYDAEEDEAIEESFLETPAASKRAEQIAPIQNKREFDWLTNIVEEETQQVRVIQEANRGRKFVFSRQPAWLRQPTEKREAAPNAPVMADDDDDFDDVDLPPWLQ